MEPYQVVKELPIILFIECAMTQQISIGCEVFEYKYLEFIPTPTAFTYFSSN